MSSWDRVVALAEEQWGMFTRQQAEQRGMAWSTLSRMSSAGRTERLGHGVYRLRGGVPPPQAALRVAWLELAPSVPVWDRVGDQGVLSHRSAGLLNRDYTGNRDGQVLHRVPIRRGCQCARLQEV